MQGQQQYQPNLFTVFDMEALIPKRHLLRQVDRVIDFGFVREATADLYCQDNGRPSIDPELFVRICMITYLYNIPSDRQVCEEIQYNLAYRWFLRLSLEDPVPDHSSLTRIRDRLGEKVFKEIFEHIVRICIEKGIVKGDKLMMDGSLVKADAALNSLIPKPENLDIKANAPTKNIKGKKFSNETHVSKTDPDSTLAGKKGEPKHLRHKVHETIDRDSRIILDAHITTGSEVDGKQMLERIVHIEETFNINVDEFTGDRGYGYAENLKKLEEMNIKSFVPRFHTDAGDRVARDSEGFVFDKEGDFYTCPQGHKMYPITGSNSDYKRYRIKGGHCSRCPLREKCFNNQTMKARNAKHIEVHIHHAALEKTAGREKTWVFKRTLAERQWKMEGIFAEAKDNHGLDRARYRGRSKMQIQAYLIASVQNLKRLAGHLPAIAAALQESAAGTLEVFSSTFFQRNTDLKLQFYFF